MFDLSHLSKLVTNINMLCFLTLFLFCFVPKSHNCGQIHNQGRSKYCCEYFNEFSLAIARNNRFGFGNIDQSGQRTTQRSCVHPGGSNVNTHRDVVYFQRDPNPTSRDSCDPRGTRCDIRSIQAVQSWPTQAARRITVSRYNRTHTISNSRRSTALRRS